MFSDSVKLNTVGYAVRFERRDVQPTILIEMKAWGFSPAPVRVAPACAHRSYPRVSSRLPAAFSNSRLSSIVISRFQRKTLDESGGALVAR